MDIGNSVNKQYFFASYKCWKKYGKHNDFLGNNFITQIQIEYKNLKLQFNLVYKRNIELNAETAELNSQNEFCHQSHIMGGYKPHNINPMFKFVEPLRVLSAASGDPPNALI